MQVSKAQKVQSIELNFDRNDFSFTKNGNGTLSINSDKYICGYDSSTAEPALPLIPINIRVPHGSSYKGVLETSTPNLVCNNVIVEKNSVMIPTNSSITIDTSKDSIRYASEVYPQANLQFVEMSDFDGYSILRVLVCPFKYTTNDNNLYIIGHIKLAINVNGISTLTNEELQGGSNMNELVKSTSISPFGFESETLASSTLPTIQDKSQLVNYVIITSSDSAKNFEPLAVWKKTKGLNAEVVTLDDIKDNYPEADMQLSIKSYLHDMYLNRGLKYALLGGDNTVVPVRMCYMDYTEDKNENNIPTDLYYACFGRCFSWDGNGNGIYGETTDNVSFDPSIFVTRVPVRTSSDVRAVVNKIIGYEKEPLKKIWNNTMLTAGSFLIDKSLPDNPAQSDAEAKGNNLYENYIEKYWDGTRKSLYDTYSDFTGGADYDFTGGNFQEQLQKGFNFVDVIAHGRPRAWRIENEDYYTVELPYLFFHKTTLQR